jgi:hypothetical protein
VLGRYYSPSQKKAIDARLPEGYEGSEFGPHLRAFVYMLYFQGRVPQNKIERILKGMNVEISDSEISRMILRHEVELEQEGEKARLAALEKCNFVQIDDTGARILPQPGNTKGKKLGRMQNGHTIVTSNPFFCSFQTGVGKSRLEAVQALSGKREIEFLINRTSLQLLRGRIGKKHWKTLKRAQTAEPFDQKELDRKLKRMEHLPQPSREEIEMACAIAAYRYQKDGNGPSVLVSDDASNYKGIFRLHQICWVHEFRRYRVLHAFGQYQEKLIEDHLKQMGKLYKKLKRYKIDPELRPVLRKEIEKEFDELFLEQTPMNALNEQRGLTIKRKAGLLLVLDHPFVPLHNNESETDLRERVLKRNISYGNRSWAGVKAWDLHLGLMHTCRKNGIGYWDYLKDRFTRKNQIPSLHRVIQAAA